MNSNELRLFIIERLADSTSMDDIITTICVNQNLSWENAARLVEHIRQEEEHTISRKQFPLLVILAIGTFVGGVGVLIYSLYSLQELLVTGLFFENPEASILMFIPYLVQYAWIYITQSFLGLGMVLGSLMGMRKMWGSILKQT